MKQKYISLLISLSFVVISGSALAVTSSPTDTVKGRAPVLTASTIASTDTNTNGIIDAGDVLTIITPGTFTDADQDTETQRTYQWMADNSPISGETSATYTVKATDLGKSITVQETPHTDPATTDPEVGAAVDSNALTIAASSTPATVVIDGFVNGYPQVGTPLTTTVTLADGSTGSANSYKWQIETSIGSGTYEDIPGATSDTYTPVGTEQKRRIRVIAE
ncbi:TPA: ZirU family protein [Enterobacter cloacae]|uniref:ZirU family protein n=1 Tax=Enterobacter chuandaensis TaxID=2497875 RepID=UPI0037761819